MRPASKKSHCAPQIARVAAAGLLLSMTGGLARAGPARFDLICHYVIVSGHESYIGTQVPDHNPRVTRQRVAIDLGNMSERWLTHGFVTGPQPLPVADRIEMRLTNLPGMKEIVRRSDGAYERIDVEADKTKVIYRGRCRMAQFTPPDPLGQPYRGR